MKGKSKETLASYLSRKLKALIGRGWWENNRQVYGASAITALNKGNLEKAMNFIEMRGAV